MQKAVVFSVFIFSFFVAQAQITKHSRTVCNGAATVYNHGNKDHFNVVENCNYVNADTAQLPLPVRMAARNYLKDRVGATYYKQLKYASCQLIRNSDGLPCLYNARFAIQYYVDVTDSIRYTVSLAMDLNGNVLSRPMLPDYKTNPKFDKIITLCEAAQIASRDTQHIPNPVLSLEYSESLNSFVWVVGSSAQNKYTHATKPPYIVINAQNGHVINRIRKRLGFIRDFGEIRKEN